MINVRKYTKEDYEIVKLWTEKNGETMPLPSMLPENGYIVDGICAGFLYKTDSSICLIEHIVVNPDVDAELKNKALNEVIEHLILTAKSLSEGFEAVIVFTSQGVVVERSKIFDFEIQPVKYTMLSKGL